jgi:hypothetical protein
MTMLVYPQLRTGALSQFPIHKTRRTRTVVNRSADGSTIKLADPAGLTTEWNLTYSDLSDDEAGALQAFFAAAEGSLNGFTFLDPAGNLLASSDQLDDEVWQKDPFLSLAASGERAWRIGNGGAAGQAIAQTVAGPGGYAYCLSAWVRSDAGTTVRLRAGAQVRSLEVNSTWRRVFVPVIAETEVSAIRFAIELAAFSTLECYGIQAEAQPGPSGCRSTTRAGVYENAHLRDDVLAIAKTGVNRHSCTVNIIHANHI